MFFSKHIGEGIGYNVPKDGFEKIDYVVGASMLCSKDFLKEVGLLSEDFFLYFEEMDWYEN